MNAAPRSTLTRTQTFICNCTPSGKACLQNRPSTPCARPAPHPFAVPPTLSSLSQLAILNASSVLGRLLPSFLADQLGVYNMLIPSLVASSVVLFGVLFVKNFTGVIVFGSLYGFTSGACTRICSLAIPRKVGLTTRCLFSRYIVDPAPPRPADDGDQ